MTVFVKKNIEKVFLKIILYICRPIAEKMKLINVIVVVLLVSVVFPLT
jgi:hypothetical protein